MQERGVNVSSFIVVNDNGEHKSYPLESYSVDKKENCVIVRFNSLKFSVTYELHKDERFQTVEQIENCIHNLLEVMESKSYNLKIVEYFVRSYVKIGYDEDKDKEFQMERFTASKLN